MPFSAWLDRLRPSPRWEDVVFWALDLETSGLQPRVDRILSIGMVPIREGVIRFGERFTTFVSPMAGEASTQSTEGIAAHHLLPSDVAEAPSFEDVLPQVDRRLRQGALLVHFSNLDVAFLREAYRRLGRPWPRPPLVDTVDLLLRLHQRQQRWTPHPPPPVTGLAEARAALGLPAYPPHDALSDAVAAAELFLALRARLGVRTLRGLR